MESQPASEEEIDKFRQKYYEQIEFDYWQERLFTAYRRYNKLKKPENKAKYIVEIYSIYLQVIEILIIHMHAMTVRSKLFLIALSIGNNDIRAFAEKVITNREFLQRFTHNFVYKIRGIKEPNEADSARIKFDIDILIECLKDYTANYNFLNSYKHGFRLHSTHGKNYVAIGKTPNNMMQVLNGDSQLTYYEFGHDKGATTISEVMLTFNHMRVVGKAMFAVYYLQNMRLSILNAYNKAPKVEYPIFYINDMEAWHKDFGQSRFSTELFRIVKTKK